MNRIFLVLIAILTSTTISAQTTIYSNDFNSSSGWSLGAANNFDTWTVDVITGCPSTPDKGSGKCLHIYDDLFGSTNCNEAGYYGTGGGGSCYAAMTSDISTAGYTSVNISFSWICQGQTGNLLSTYGFIEYSTNSGSTWTRINSPRAKFDGQSTWTSATISSANVPGIANQSTLRLRFGWTSSGYGSNPAFAIDDLLITGEGASCNLTAETLATDVKCNGENNGSILLTESNGTSPYTYIWSNAAETKNLSELAAGTYSVTVTDANGCTATSSAIVSEPQALSISSAQVNATCNGSSTGSIQLLVTGGTSPYSYNWSNGSQNKDLSNLTAGSYSVTVTDANGCTEVKSINITEPLSLDLSETHTAAGCDNASGSIDLTVEGGTAPYTYLWSNSAATQDLSGLSAGDYSVVVTDANGCTAAIEVTVESTSSACGVPSDIQVTNITSGAATATWGAQPCTYRFRVRYRPVGSDTWASSLPTEVGSNTKRLTNLIAGTEYEIQVRANCSSGTPEFTDWSTSEYFTTNAACTAPTGVTATNLRKTRATIMWDAMSGAYSYEVRYRETGDTLWKRRPAVAPATSKILTNLIAGSQYEYQVRSICDVSGKPKSEWSALQTFNTQLRMEESAVSSVTDLNIYPNPNKGIFTVQLNNKSTEKGTIEIYNILGERIISNEVTLTEGVNSFNINMEKYLSGVYMIMIKTQETNSTDRILISK